jgi:hypothetical protein
MYVLHTYKKQLNRKISTGEYFSEALILASTIPQYDKRLFIKLQIQYMKIASSEHVLYINCSEWQKKPKKQKFVHTTCSEIAFFMYWTRNSMNNLLSYCGLVDAKIRASDKDLTVESSFYSIQYQYWIWKIYHEQVWAIFTFFIKA